MSIERFPLIAIDQNKHVIYLKTQHPRKELMQQLHCQHVDMMYRDAPTPGGARHVGYVIAGHWIELFHLVPWKSELSSASCAAPAGTEAAVTQVCNESQFVMANGASLHRFAIKIANMTTGSVCEDDTVRLRELITEAQGLLRRRS